MTTLNLNASELVRKGKKCSDKEEAIVYYDKAIKKDFKCVGAYIHKGLALFELERCDEAIKCYNMGIKLEKKYKKPNRIILSGLENKKQKALETKKKIRKEQKHRELITKVQTVKEELINHKFFLYIQNFVQIYGKDYSTNETKKLLDLLILKNFDINKETLEIIIQQEIEHKEYKKFRIKILYNEPRILKDYVINLIEIYGNNYSKYNDFFLMLLNEDMIIHIEDEINNIIDQINKEKELLIFEKKTFRCH